MASTTSPDGIIYPTLSDQGDDIPAVLATMAGSIQDALTALRSEIDANDAVTTVTQATFGVPAAGYTVDSFALRRSGQVISGTLRVTKSTGLVHGEAMFTVNAGYRPAHGTVTPLPSNHSGGGQGATAGGCVLDLADGGTIKALGLNGIARTTAEIALNWIIA